MGQLKKWEQKTLPLASDGSHRGGKRAGAGRKRRAPRPLVPHRSRTAITRHTPVHVTFRLGPQLGNVRRRRTYKAIRHATYVCARGADARIVHISVQANHLHLLVEARDAHALGRGMRRFAISAAMQLNKALGAERCTKVHGPVFTDRYHAVVINSPKQARAALAYVLNNWLRHQEHLRDGQRSWGVDLYSSAPLFVDWADLVSPAAIPRDYDPPKVHPPDSWLLRAGWKRAGGIRRDRMPFWNTSVDH
jgi:REP element-mobilizing transposase RayT